MRRLIPGKTKVQIELFKGVLLSDIAVAAVFAVMALFVVLSSLPFKGYICLGLLFIAALLLSRLDTQPNYTYLLNILRHVCYKRSFGRRYTDEMLKEKDGKDAETQDGDESGEIPPNETRKERKEVKFSGPNRSLPPHAFY